MNLCEAVGDDVQPVLSTALSCRNTLKIAGLISGIVSRFHHALQCHVADHPSEVDVILAISRLQKAEGYAPERLYVDLLDSYHPVNLTITAEEVCSVKFPLQIGYRAEHLTSQADSVTLLLTLSKNVWSYDGGESHQDCAHCGDRLDGVSKGLLLPKCSDSDPSQQRDQCRGRPDSYAGANLPDQLSPCSLHHPSPAAGRLA